MIITPDAFFRLTGCGEGEVTARWQANTTTLEGEANGGLSVRFIPRGGIAIPGFTDSHAHILEYGAAQELALEGSKTIQGNVIKRGNEFPTILLTWK